MKPSEVPEMQEYMQCISNAEGCETLVKVEAKAVEQVESYSDRIDSAPLQGAHVMTAYWREAESAEKQAALAKIAHLRARAWFAVLDIVRGPACCVGDRWLGYPIMWEIPF